MAGAGPTMAALASTVTATATTARPTAARWAGIMLQGVRPSGGRMSIRRRWPGRPRLGSRPGHRWCRDRALAEGAAATEASVLDLKFAFLLGRPGANFKSKSTLET